MQKKNFSVAGLCPGPNWGACSSSSDPYSWYGERAEEFFCVLVYFSLVSLERGENERGKGWRVFSNYLRTLHYYSVSNVKFGCVTQW